MGSVNNYKQDSCHKSFGTKLSIVKHTNIIPDISFWHHPKLLIPIGKFEDRNKISIEDNKEIIENNKYSIMDWWEDNNKARVT